jgi:hypothetical protein
VWQVASCGSASSAYSSQLSTQIAARAASGRIVALASDRLGLAPVTAENRTYLDLRR